MFYRGNLLKRFDVQDNECVEIIRRLDGMYQFAHRRPCKDSINFIPVFESGAFISAETAEAAARRKFNLV